LEIWITIIFLNLAYVVRTASVQLQNLIFYGINVFGTRSFFILNFDNGGEGYTDLRISWFCDSKAKKYGKNY
jgi:hypothetical protein